MYYTLEELSNYQDTNLNLVAEIPKGETTVRKEIFSNANLNFFMKNVYGKRILIKDCDSLSDAFESFVDYFVYYKTIFQDDLNRLYNAWILEYNPIENYDRIEQSETNLLHGETHTIVGSDNYSSNKTDTASGTDTTTEKFKNTTEEYESGMNSSNTFTPTRKTTNDSKENGNTTDLLHGETHTIVDSGNNSNNKTDTASGTDTTSINSRTHGNIGVTTSQQMLQSELDLRMKMQVENFVKFIIDKFTIMI